MDPAAGHGPVHAPAADALLDALFTQTSVGVVLAELGGRLLRANARYAELLRLPLEALQGCCLADVLPPSAVEALRSSHAALRAGGGTDLTLERLHTRADGSAVWLSVSLVPLRGPGGDVTHVLGLVRDSTAQHAAEAARCQSAQRFQALVERAHDLIAILEPDGTNRYASPSHLPVLGLPPGTLEGQNSLEHVHPEEREALARAYREVLGCADPSPPRPFRFRRRQDGTWRTLMVILTDLTQLPGVRGIVANSRDVTEQLRLQEALAQAQRLEALGRLAGGVAHDFNNILGAITLQAQLLRDGLDAGDPRREEAEEVVRTAERGTGVVRQLLAFARKQALATEVLDLAEVTRGLGRMLQALLPRTITLHLPPLGAPPVHVRAARPQLEQIVLNLALNARDAMPGGGALHVEVGVTPTAAEGGPPRATLTVRDTGQGIAPDVQERIFEPFFTTKPEGQGTGLGLATVYGLVRQFDGEVRVCSEEGRGATFRVLLPLASEAPVAARRARVLVVDDEPSVRRAARRILAADGHHVAEAPDGHSALEALEREGPFDAVLSDASMPGGGGAHLAQAVAGRWPELPVVLMSGHARDTLAPGAPAHAFLQKPFTPQELRDVLARALGPRPTG